MRLAVRDDQHRADYQVVYRGAVVGVTAVAAAASYEDAYALVRAYGETGWIGRLVPLTVDGLIYASSMVMLDSARRKVPVPALARWLLGLGIAATLAANVAHGLGHGPVGAAVAAWPAIALVGSYELFMTIIRGTRQPGDRVSEAEHVSEAVSETDPLRGGRGLAHVVCGRGCLRQAVVRLGGRRVRVGLVRGRWPRSGCADSRRRDEGGVLVRAARVPVPLQCVLVECSGLAVATHMTEGPGNGVRCPERIREVRAG
jgi:hypothetical protein